jgi:diguanylate cyclase (GGDEF)-like protein
MESLHLPTMVMLIIFVQILSCLTMFATWKIDREMPGIGLWCLGSTVNLAAFVIYAGLTTAEQESHLGVIVVDAFRIFAALTAFLGALRLRQFIAPPGTQAWLLICGLIAGACWLVNLDVRLGIVVPDAGTAVLAMLASITLVWRNSSSTERKVFGITAFFLSLAGFAFGARALQAWAVLDEAQLQTFSYAAMPFAIMLMSIAGWSSGVIMACYYRSQQRMQAMAREDLLTGMPNRRGLEEALARELAKAQREHTHFGIVLIDIDHFKQVNDQYGHSCGDNLLQELAWRLQHFVRDADLAGRLGGDEFLLILPGLHNLKDLQNTLTRLRRSVNGEAQLQGRELNLTISAGGALWPDDGDTVDALMNHADKAMYAFKRARGVQRSSTSEEILAGA